MSDLYEQPEARERPTPELMRELSDQATTLIRKEIELVKVELDVKRRKATAGAGMFGGAAFLGLFAFGAVTACLILALSTFLAPWLAALIVAVVYGAIAGGTALVGKNRVARATPPVPEQAMESAKEDIEWTKQRVKSSRR
jgi:Putative Actinobacterial Holin-X, holin superfamily III